MKFDGTKWLSSVIGINDVTNLNSTLDTYLQKNDFANYVLNAGCVQHETMYWSAALGFQCQPINVGLAGDITGSLGSTTLSKIKGVPVDTTGLTGGSITSTGTISLADTAVTPGSYTRANLTVDAQGRITAASNGAAINLATEVSGALPVLNGGTGQTTALGAFNALSPLSTKGDLLVRDATNNIRFPVGGNGQVLSADAGQSSGLRWVTPTNGTVTNVTGTAPIVVSNGTTVPDISVSDATSSTKGVVQIGGGLAVTGGTTRMSILSNGNVGIGTTNPGAKLHVQGDASFENSTATVGGANFSFWKTRNYAATQSGDELDLISFYGHDGSGLRRSSYIASKAEGAPSAGSVPAYLALYTTPAGSADSVERLRVSSSGNVGIETQTPTYALSVYRGTASTTTNTESGNSGSAVQNRYAGFTDGAASQVWATGMNISNGTAGYELYDYTAGASRLFVNTAGNVGICMEKTLRTHTSINGMGNGSAGNNAIAVCKGVGPGSRLCTHNDFQQACGSRTLTGVPDVDPYGGQVNGVYGDHSSIATGQATWNPAGVPVGQSDDVFLTWNGASCSDNNDGMGRHGAETSAFYFRCCY